MLEGFLSATADDSPESIALRTLTLHMLEHLAPKFFQARGLATIQHAALEQCASVECVFDPLDEDRLEAGIDAWYCRHVKGLPHRPPDRERLRLALQTFAADDRVIYAWLLGQQAARCGLEVRVVETPRHVSLVHEVYWLTHLVLLESDYFARPIQRDDWADALEKLVPWLLVNPHADLAGEVAFCLRFLGRDARALFPIFAPVSESRTNHEMATALLALSAE